MPDLTPQMERELAELEAILVPDIRDTRPAPDDAWVRRMDALMEAEFKAAAEPRPSRGRRWMHLLMTGPALGTAAAAVLVIALVFSYQGSGGTDDSDSGSASSAAMEESGGGGSSEGPVSAAARDSAAGGGTEESAPMPEALSGDVPDSSIAPVPPSQGSGSPGSDGRENRKVERSAAISLAVRPRNIDPVSRQVSDLADAQGGFVVSSSVAASRTGGGGTITLRVPERNLDATMSEVARLG